MGKYQRRGTLPWLRRAFLESTDTDVQAAPPHLLIPPDHGISDESRTLLPEEFITSGLIAGLHHVSPSNSTPPNSTVGLFPSPASGISRGDFSNNTHSLTPVDAASNFSAAVTLPDTLHAPPPVESRVKREPRNPRHLHQKSRKKGEVESLHWSRLPADVRKALIRQFSCNDCGTEYVQRQGLNRHRREKHEPSLCVYCNAEWGRPYEYRDHLEQHHPDVDRDMVLGKAAGSRCRSAILARRRPQQV